MPVISPGPDEAAAQALAPPKLCAGCGAPIADRFYLLAVERQWHTRCLRCCHCKQQLDSELTCFARDGNIYCKEDYYRLFAVKRCARCQQGIFASELVMRARDLVYHLHCFTCAWCNAALAQGDHFGLRDNLVYCRTHFELLAEGCQPGLPPPPPPPLLQDDDGGGSVGAVGACSPPLAQGAAYAPPQGPYGVRKGRPRKRKPGELPEGPPHLGVVPERPGKVATKQSTSAGAAHNFPSGKQSRRHELIFGTKSRSTPGLQQRSNDPRGDSVAGVARIVPGALLMAPELK